MSLDNAFNDVKAFHKAFGVPTEDKPTLLEENRVATRSNWMIEEIEEFAEANTIAQQADAMIDLMYFALGTLVEMGVKPQALFNIVQNANMSKLWEDGKPRYREGDHKILKPPTWQDPDPLLYSAIIEQLSDSVDEANGDFVIS